MSICHGTSIWLYDVLTELSKDENKGQENYMKFLKAQTRFFAERWWLALLWGIQKSGVKTKLGMGAIASCIGHTGGFPNAMQSGGLIKGGFYDKIVDWSGDAKAISGVSSIDGITALEPAVAGADKEAAWIKAYFAHFSKGVTNYANRSKDFIKYADQRSIRYYIIRYNFAWYIKLW